MGGKKNKSDLNRLAMILSGLILPGTGQLVQRRWFAAFVFGGGFLACLVVFSICAGKTFMVYYSLGFSLSAPVSEEKIPLGWMLISFAASLAFYVAGLIDTYFACRRFTREDQNHPVE